MRKTTLMALGVAVFGLPLLALAADLNGSWLQDPKSERVPEPMWLTRAAPTGRGGGRAGGPGGRGAGADAIMIIQQTGNNLQITDTVGGVRKLTLDGKPATVTTETFMGKATVSAKMDGDKLVISTSRPYGGMPGNVGLEIKEEWSLSSDGKTLSVTTTHTSPAVQKTYKQTFNRR